MKTIKVSLLSGAALDWVVAKCEGITPMAVKKKYSEGHILYSLPASTIPLEYSTDWAQGGLIIEREGIGIWPSASGDHDGEWCARKIDTYITYSTTPLIAAMRCYVASKLGDTIDIPEELI